MNAIKRLTMSHISLVEFDEIRDGIEELNDQLEEKDHIHTRGGTAKALS